MFDLILDPKAAGFERVASPPTGDPFLLSEGSWLFFDWFSKSKRRNCSLFMVSALADGVLFEK